MAVQRAKVKYGPRKLGEEAFEAQEALKKRSHRAGTVYGDRKGGGERVSEAPEPVNEPAADQPSVAPDPDAPNQPHASTAPGPDADANPMVVDGKPLTLEELEEKLEREPQLLDLAIKAEFEGEPRKGACKLFLQMEQDRQGEPRPKVLKLLEQHV